MGTVDIDNFPARPDDNTFDSTIEDIDFTSVTPIPDQDLVIVRTGPAAGYFPKIIEEWDNAYLFNRAVRGLGKRD